MNATKTVEEHRQFVEPNEFVELLTCTRRLVRCDRPGGTVRELLDLDSGHRYCIRDRDLERLGERN